MGGGKIKTIMEPGRESHNGDMITFKGQYHEIFNNLQAPDSCVMICILKADPLLPTLWQLTPDVTGFQRHWSIL